MAKKQDIIALKLFSEIMKQAENPPLHPGEVETAVFDSFDSWRDYLVEQLTKLIADWETEVPDDSSLYTLGLRRAIDVVKGDNPILPAGNEAV